MIIMDMDTEIKRTIATKAQPPPDCLTLPAQLIIIQKYFFPLINSLIPFFLIVFKFFLCAS